MVHAINSKTFRGLILEFVEGEIPAERFISRFIRLWKKARDAQRSKKQNWSEPFDEQLKAAFLEKKISPEQFSARWKELWGYRSENDVKFQDLIDKLFSACDAYEDDPPWGSEHDEHRLRSFVAEAFSTYLLALTREKDKEVGAC